MLARNDENTYIKSVIKKTEKKIKTRGNEEEVKEKEKSKLIFVLLKSQALCCGACYAKEEINRIVLMVENICADAKLCAAKRTAKVCNINIGNRTRR